MKVLSAKISDVKIIIPDIFNDDRGYFFESFSYQKINEIGLDAKFIQDNESLSTQKGVLRGLHFQNNPFAQGKLIRVIKGSVFDVAVDIRKNSKTYGEHFALELNEENKTMLYIPPGFAHGFVTLRDNTIFNYKCTNYYNKASEDGILWNDKDLNINWGVENPILSEKDENNQLFKNFKSLF